MRVDLRMLAQMTEHGQSRGHGQRIARERARLVHRPQRRDQVHDLGFATVGAYGQAAADDLSQSSKVGLNAKERLRATVTQTKAGHDLIENQQRFCARGNFAQGLQITRRRRHAAHVAHHRLDNHTGNLSGKFFKGQLHSGKIVVGQRESELGHLFGNAGRAGNAERSHS